MTTLLNLIKTILFNRFLNFIWLHLIKLIDKKYNIKIKNLVQVFFK